MVALLNFIRKVLNIGLLVYSGINSTQNLPDSIPSNKGNECRAKSSPFPEKVIKKIKPCKRRHLNCAWLRLGAKDLSEVSRQAPLQSLRR